MSNSPDGRYQTWFDQRLKDKLDDLVEAADPDNDRNLRDEFDETLTSHGNSEEKIAKSHEGRELIELIQNARDAIHTDGPGQVYVAILDQGILVANTGEPFDLLDRDTERAVKMIGESNKTAAGESGVDLDSNSIGHIGVGLKSTVAVGDDFEVWSRRAGDSKPLRVRYSRAYITAAVLARFGNTLPEGIDLTAGAVGPFADRADELFTPAEPFRTKPRKPLDDLGKAPQFWFPWPLNPDHPGPSNQTLAERANSLLTNQTESLDEFQSPPAEPFKTAVFIEYQDDDWRTLVEAFEIPTPIDETSDPSTRADELWARLSYHSSRTEGFDPETLINLGKIDDLYLERISGTETVAAEHWNLKEQDPDRSLPVDEVSHRRCEVTVTSREHDEQILSYDSFQGEWNGTETTRPRVIIEQPRDEADGTTRASYPLHLYYPISSTSGSLPVCIHGRFRVTTERKDLSRSEAAHNRAVLADAAKLLGHIGAGAARLASDPTAPAHWDRYPWLLLPGGEMGLTADEDEPKDTPEMLSWVRGRTIETLRETDSIATTAGPAAVADTVCYPSTTVLRGLAANVELAEVGDRVDHGGPDAESLLPTSGTLREAYDQVTSTDGTAVGVTRLEAFVGSDRAEATLRAWTPWLSGTLSAPVDEDETASETVRTVDQTHGRELFNGIVDLINAAVDESTEYSEIQEFLDVDWLQGEQGLTGVHILPCQRTARDGDLDLVPIRPVPKGNVERGAQSARTVFWGIGKDTVSASYPPTHGQFDVFFLDREVQQGTATEVLEAAGKAQTWGVRNYESFPDLFEAFLRTFRPTGSNIDLETLAGLTQYISEIEEDSDRLSQTELSIGGRGTFESAASSSDTRGRLRLRLAVRRSTLDSERLPNRPLSDMTLSGRWQHHRSRALHSADTQDSEESPTTEDGSENLTGLPLNQVPDPASEIWDGFALDTMDPAMRQKLARSLSLLGVSSLPGIRYLPLHGDAHPVLNQIPGWEPAMWDDTDQPEWIVAHRQRLRQAIEATEYRQIVTSDQYHPRTTINHGSCERTPTTPSSSNQQSYLIGWVWFDTEQLAALADYPDAVRSVLGQYTTVYQQQLLTTKWDCRRYSTTCSRRDRNLPTVANLQLRQLPIWDAVVAVTETFEETDVWATETNRLDCAVLETGSGGRPGWRLFPHVDLDDPELHVDEEFLETLGVVALEDLGLLGAEHRLQRLQAELAAVSEPDLQSREEPVQLNIPQAQRGNWKRAYSLLLAPILKAWGDADNESADETLDRLFSKLTHLPVRRGDEWYAAPVSWIRSNGGDAIWRYPERNPPRWVTSKLATAKDGKPGFLLERPATATGFDAFVEHGLQVPQITATEPNLSIEAFEDRQQPISDLVDPGTLDTWRNHLKNRLPLLLAVISTQNDERLESETERLRTAIQHIALVEKLPPGIKTNLSDPRSITYEIDGSTGGKGIALVKSEIESPELSALSQALALLLGQFTHLSRFQRILEADEYGEARRWFEGTLPVDTAEAFLNRQRRTNIRTRLQLGASLLDRFGASRPPVQGATSELETLSNEETARFQRLTVEIRDGEGSAELPVGLSEYIAACRTADSWLRETVVRVLDPGEAGVGALRDYIAETCPPEHREELIEWLVNNRTRIPGKLADDETLGQCRRLAAADNLWVEHEASFLESATDWQTALEAESFIPSWAAPLPDYADREKHGQFWIELTNEDRVEPLIEVFVNEISAELPDETTRAVRDYIAEGEPLPADAGSTQNHKARAFAAATNHLSEHDLSGFGIMSGTGGSVHPSQSEGGTPGRGSESSSQSFTGRGEIAEVAVTIEVLERTSRWISNGDGRLKELSQRFEAMYERQVASEVDYQWHTNRRWNRELLPLLEDGADRLGEEVANWKAKVRSGTSLAALTPVSLLDVSAERGPGFDLIDPLYNRETAVEGVNPCPIEIKSVSSTEPPYGIKLTTNEYQQCKLHIEQSDHPYVIQLVYVPTDDPRVEDAEGVGTYPINNTNELQQLLGESSFDMRVRSGYLRSTFDSH